MIPHLLGIRRRGEQRGKKARKSSDSFLTRRARRGARGGTPALDRSGQYVSTCCSIGSPRQIHPWALTTSPGKTPAFSSSFYFSPDSTCSERPASPAPAPAPRATPTSSENLLSQPLPIVLGISRTLSVRSKGQPRIDSSGHPWLYATGLGLLIIRDSCCLVQRHPRPSQQTLV